MYTGQRKMAGANSQEKRRRTSNVQRISPNKSITTTGDTVIFTPTPAPTLFGAVKQTSRDNQSELEKRKC